MPLCTSCTHPIDYLYTVYSKHNVRLEQCSNCRQFADKYVEYDWLTIWLDLILMKPGVYRHLLFNRGASPRFAEHVPGGEKYSRTFDGQDRARWHATFTLGLALVTLDAYIRWSYRYPIAQSVVQFWTPDAREYLVRTWLGCFVENVAFDGTVMLACLCVKLLLAQTNRFSISSTRDQLRASHIPLTVIYSSFTKLFLLVLISIWRSPQSDNVSRRDPVFQLPPFLDRVVWGKKALEAFDEDKLDREWVVRNLIGGMAAGFGLRVVLDSPPAITTLVVIVGWAIKSAVAWLISEWVDQDATQRWIAYSIP